MNEMQSFLLEGEGIRGAIVRIEETWTQTIAQHRYPPAVRDVLGQSIAATVLMANGLKKQPKVSLQLQGGGPLRLLVVQCARDLKVRGMAQWRPFAPGDPMLGKGRLSVILDTGERQGVFQGIVPLVSSQLDACLEAYFHQSEQLATRLVLHATPNAVAGLMLQALPGQEPDREDFAAAAEQAKSVASEALLTAPAPELLPALFPDRSIRLFKPRPVLHDCRCTPEHLAGVARMLGADELHDILADEGAVEMTCEFCNRTFRYDADDVETIIRGDTPEAIVH